MHDNFHACKRARHQDNQDIKTIERQDNRAEIHALFLHVHNQIQQLLAHAYKNNQAIIYLLTLLLQMGRKIDSTVSMKIFPWLLNINSPRRFVTQ